MAAWPMLMSLRRQYPHVALDKNHQKHPIKHPRTQFLSPLFCALAILFSFSIYQSFRADLKQSGSWGCEMSWMSPSYRRLEWIDFISTRYALYLYREQGWDSEDTLSGHPVLFVPGNAGSYQQVRSVASSTSKQFYEQMKEKERSVMTAKKIDFFTADLKEEFSAFHARTLREQAVFIQHCIKGILQEYTHLPQEKRPTQVTLLAHSMGGVVARLAMDPATSISVDIIVTLSTPHIIPPLALERDMDSIYSLISWRRQHISTHPPLISICGGISDTQVVSDSCALPFFQTGNNSDIAVFTTGIPGVWTAVEHQAIVWCHQIRWRIARMLLDMSNRANTAAKLVTAKKWLLDYQENETLKEPHSERQHDYSVSSRNTTFIELHQPSKAFVAQQCNGLEPCRTVPSVMSLLPFPRNPSDPFPLPGEGIKPSEVMLAAEVSLSSTNTVVKINASKYGRIIAGSREHHLVKGNSWINSSLPSLTTHHLFHFENACLSSLVTHSLEITLGHCEDFKPLIKHVSQPALELRSATFESNYYFASGRPIHLHSHSTGGPFLPYQEGTGIYLEIFQSPLCPVQQVSLRRNYYNILAKSVTRYRMVVLAWPVGWAAAVLLFQLSDFISTGEILPWNSTLEGFAGRWMPIYIALLLLGASIQSQLPDFPILHTFFLGVNQLQMVPLVGILAVWTFGLLCIVSFVITACLWLLSYIIGQPHSHERFEDGTKSKHDWLGVVMTGAIAVSVNQLIPHQLIFLLCVILLWLSAARSKAPNNRCHLNFTCAIFTTLLIPFKILQIAIWSRNIWFGSAAIVNTDSNLYYAVPPVLLVRCTSSSGTIPKRYVCLQACRIALIMLIMSSFFVGARWTWILPPIANAVLVLFVASIM
ncbi:GPI inositol-deacylase [Cryptococcus neoformans AD2-60a]|uniref:GPI inositol-deacylase n=1 Tax=Cryptococcus neoformans (strain H99 / ATCC 208821 / CBS 10515 / FGSC 9487) TaxID=235443 RepID=T2BP65_CRYN9|nr:GPI inositol-deacylase, variant [Cryptococcus neoformans var. grubii H99]AUB25855.1 GPI inositol-deacylase [Cryptococcus neoformans var. grubii]OWZ30406.1 GPI inositol-deacylase [Cryptococcus neoformans var. grubii AD2-60a]OXG56657.1 GPI inositol-deacylase [Cryptococcus neoformans var. grubii MW-RSA1955]OXG84900.1 GPI inositol-deacylase [Cryptococcus neoformans var. grubii D17-1]OXG94708.1 GPI inositol-deacylase [Cryptococcus neoformans var. grubii A2-102-5]OXH08501.1 GPI inositol-deacylas|eukprot:XP_012050446.1 GPI inositol-deacylase, variant [Cryptococcus neoformans var. grubii H99]